MNDPIGDFIIRIKNAGKVKKPSVFVPFSKIKLAIAELLYSKGFVGEINQKTKGKTKQIVVNLLYDERGTPIISNAKRISKPGRRIYKKSKEIRRFAKGFGLSVFSTPKGILADVDAKKDNLGGEFLFSIW